MDQGRQRQTRGLAAVDEKIQGLLTMTYKHHTLRSALIVALLTGIICKAVGSVEPALMERTLAAIQDWMARSAAPWPDAWQHENNKSPRHRSVG